MDLWFCLQCMLWNTFGPISQSLLAVYCPDWTEATLALLGNWGNIMYLIPVVPVMWYFNTQGAINVIMCFKRYLRTVLSFLVGLRKSTLLAAGLMVAVSAIRCIPFKLQAFTW